MFKILKLLLFDTVSLYDNVIRRQCHICKKRTPFPLFNQLTVYFFSTWAQDRPQNLIDQILNRSDVIFQYQSNIQLTWYTLLKE